MAKMARIRVSRKYMIANNHEIMDGFYFITCWSCSSRWRWFPLDSIGVSYRDSSHPQGGECGMRTTLLAPKRLNLEAAISQSERWSL